MRRFSDYWYRNGSKGGSGVILDQIIRHKKKEIETLKKLRPLAFLKQAIRKLPKKKACFLTALKKKAGVAVIAEIKKRSPSGGVLRNNFNPPGLAKSYEAGGACALSVLTDKKYFGGGTADLIKVRQSTKLPILRKDFTIDEYQIYESRLIGADAILLIAAVLSARQIRHFAGLAGRLGLDALIEVHTAGDFRKLLRFRPQLIGINNRNLKNFHVDIHTTVRLAKLAPRNSVLVSESGIQNRQQLKFLKSLSVKAVLVGESLIRQKDVRKALLKLRGIGNG